MTKEELIAKNKNLFERNTILLNENRLLGERCNQLLKDKGELTDKIDNIKANCDLAIEGRDIKIKELELELTVEKDQHQEEINLHLHAEDYIKELEKENEELRNNGFTVSAMTEQQLKVALEKGEQLEKENAELKTDKQYWEQKSNRLAIEWGETLDQLAQAKSYIKYFVGILKNLGADKEELVIEAEQFIREIEK